MPKTAPKTARAKTLITVSIRPTKNFKFPSLFSSEPSVAQATTRPLHKPKQRSSFYKYTYQSLGRSAYLGPLPKAPQIVHHQILYTSDSGSSHLLLNNQPLHRLKQQNLCIGPRRRILIQHRMIIKILCSFSLPSLPKEAGMKSLNSYKYYSCEMRDANQGARSAGLGCRVLLDAALGILRSFY